MKHLRIFEYKCPLCEKVNRDLEGRKPTIHTPTICKINCDECESRLTIKVLVPRNRENKNTYSLQLVSVQPSQKLLEMMKQAELENLKESLEAEVQALEQGEQGGSNESTVPQRTDSSDAVSEPRSQQESV